MTSIVLITWLGELEKKIRWNVWIEAIFCDFDHKYFRVILVLFKRFSLIWNGAFFFSVKYVVKVFESKLSRHTHQTLMRFKLDQRGLSKAFLNLVVLLSAYSYRQSCWEITWYIKSTLSTRLIPFCLDCGTLLLSLYHSFIRSVSLFRIVFIIIIIIIIKINIPMIYTIDIRIHLNAIFVTELVSHIIRKGSLANLSSEVQFNGKRVIKKHMAFAVVVI